MHPNLMHSSSERPAKHHTCSTIEAQAFKLCFAFFALWGNLANSNFVADNFNGLWTRYGFTEMRFATCYKTLGMKYL